MSLTQEFVVFWERYPRKVGKLAAEKAYQRARKSGVTQQQILDGIDRYMANKPEYADWAHPTTWLNQGRWDDDYSGPRADRPVVKPRTGEAYKPYVPLRLRDLSNG